MDQTHALKLLSIDPGVMHMGWILMTPSKILNMGVQELVRDASPAEDEFLHNLNTWCATNIDLLSTADIIVLERQRTTNYFTQLLCECNSVLSAWFWPKRIIWVAPSAVSKHFKLTSKSYAAKKKKAVEVACALSPDFVAESESIASTDRNHVADAFLNARYAINLKL